MKVKVKRLKKSSILCTIKTVVVCVLQNYKISLILASLFLYLHNLLIQFNRKVKVRTGFLVNMRHPQHPNDNISIHILKSFVF